MTLGGSQGNQAAIGKIIGRSFAADEIADAIEKIIDVYVELRHIQNDISETFVDTVRRVGLDPFKARAYGTPALKVA